MTTTIRSFISLTALLLAAAILPQACTTTDKSSPKTSPPASATNIATAPAFPPVSFEHPLSPIGDMLRAFGESNGGALALMSGLEERSATAIALNNRPYEEAVSAFATAIDCTYAYTPHYFFIFPVGYEMLLDIHTNDLLSPRYQTMNASVAFGAKTKLCNLFAVLGKSLDITIVADNFLAENWAGEQFLSQAPLSAILDAALQSARVAPNAFALECTEEYLFFHAPQNADAGTRLRNAEQLTQEQKARLNTPVSLSIPALPGDNAAAHFFMAEPIPLKDALLPLTEQLGIEVAAQRKLADVPILPCYMHQLRLETALTLLLRQWPSPHFGFEFRGDRILIRADIFQ